MRISLIPSVFVAFGFTILTISACAKKADVSHETTSKPATEQTTTQAPKYKAFGDSVQSASTPLPLAEVFKTPNLQKLVRVEAKVVEVCQKKGCWMMLSDGAVTMRMTFKDYGFFMPKDIAGKTIIAEGIVAEDVLTEKDARHYAEDAGKSKEEIEKIKGDQKTVSMVAQSVFLPLSN
ncbi:MAG: DUF4920 domain-containing protein [Candidatus Kapaibacterium sp.]|nr:MAG: DUF4920 domain-containing protein [Candidatus Kapabacteria bacterium]